MISKLTHDNHAAGNLHNGATVWHCRTCASWWCSEPTRDKDTWRLVQLPELKIGAAPWQQVGSEYLVAGPDPSVCPECGTTMTGQATPATPSAIPVEDVVEHGLVMSRLGQN